MRLFFAGALLGFLAGWGLTRYIVAVEREADEADQVARWAWWGLTRHTVAMEREADEDDEAGRIARWRRAGAL